MNFWMYVVIFAIIGVPLVGFFVDKLIEFGRWIYKEIPFIRAFFDDYASYYGIGLVITVVVGIVYGLGKWFGFA